MWVPRGTWYYDAGIGEPVDYERYPSEAVQYKWIRYYLQECAAIRGLLLQCFNLDTICYSR